METYLKNLNERQLEAVKTIDGPLLVLAGAGSGKTTVLANRIAYILQNTYARPWNILAITFTNKAANEMKERIGRIIGNEVNDMWVGTFHSVCVRILRTCIDRAGYSSDFVIYDSADSRTLMKACEKELDIDEKAYPPRAMLSIISNAKNSMIDAAGFESLYSSNRRLDVAARLYKLYQKRLKENNALDFDDIIMLTVQILRDNEDIAEKYQSRFQYILVDEYQDTNNSQYELIGILAEGYGNLCVVGDDDQSIYKFRGANVGNILGFEDDYRASGAKKVTLEQNYRSTANILNAANGVIAHNSKRLGKNLWTSKADGEKISAYTGSTENDEAKYIAVQIAKRYRERKNYGDFAVLYRTNAQSRAIEEAFMRESIPYRVLAGLRFYDRKEIKDITSYLRVIYNFDNMSLRRIINEPKRKIGTATLEKLRRLGEEHGVSEFEIAKNSDMYPDLRSAAVRLKAFAQLITDLRKLAFELPVDQLVKHVINDSGYMAMLETENSVEAQTRIENLNEFVNAAHEYSSDMSNDGTLGGFLEAVTLVSDIDDYDQNSDSVVMMTIHSAKGLEFPVVFLAGMEEGLFPGARAAESKEDIEEERRLCYVAVTRAKEKLYVTRAVSRFRYGQRVPSQESRFFKEIPAEYISDDSASLFKAAKRLEKAGIEITPERIKIPEFKVNRTAPSMNTSHFAVGERVRHRKFGDGTVVSAKSFGNDAILVIDFDTAGTKRLMAAFAKLERI